MKTALAWRAGIATDPGLQRTNNEDRVFVDDSRGIFLVVDGLGGHAAGEMAAETAVHVILEHLTEGEANGDVEEKIRRAITEANNRIFELAQSNSEWRGMACVLTLAVAQDDRVTIGHVGDSRLYLVWNGNLRKLTSDHSPVGEREDLGELTECEAMHHPRRNEVFRDVGSQLRDLHDSNFIETKSFLFRPDAALLLCSDGLSDVLTSSQISSIVERYDGDPDTTARELVEAANQAGGQDNISVVFVAGTEFLGSDSNAMLEVRSRHAITRMRTGQTRWLATFRNIVWLLTGMLLGILLWAALERMTPRQVPSKPNQAHVQRLPARIAVNPADSLGIANALSIALSGDTIDVPPGEYLGPIQLKEGVSIVSSSPGTAVLQSAKGADTPRQAGEERLRALGGAAETAPVLRAFLKSDPTSATDSGVGIIARGLHHVRVQGLSIVSDDTHPLRTGILIANSTVQIEDLDISGAIDGAIRFEGDSGGLLLANFIHANPGPGVIISDTSAPRLAGNYISDNGKVPRAIRAGVEIESLARPDLERNVIVQNGLALSGAIPPDYERVIRAKNLFDKNASRGASHAKAGADGGSIP
jgi:PPM family protein phosphatase